MQNSNGTSPQVPHFFKVILHDTLSQGKLEIPRLYVIKHGSDLLNSRTMLLRLPDGKKWQMELTKSGGTIWLQNGWQEFAHHYHLKEGNFLVFRHGGGCCFEVVILDFPSASEIDYPCPGNPREGVNTNTVLQEKAEDVGDDGSDDDSLQIIGEAFDPKKTGAKSSSAGHEHRGMEGRKRWTREEKAKALGRAKDFRSNKPFFEAVMFPSYVHGGNSCMAIPTDFAMAHTSMKSEFAHLRLASGRGWRVKYHWLNKLASAAFNDGWWEFVRDNKLQVGDVCVFELVNESQLMFEVTIYRA